MCWNFTRNSGGLASSVNQETGAGRLLGVDFHCWRGLHEPRGSLESNPSPSFTTGSSHTPHSQPSLDLYLDVLPVNIIWDASHGTTSVKLSRKEPEMPFSVTSDPLHTPPYWNFSLCFFVNGFCLHLSDLTVGFKQRLWLNHLSSSHTFCLGLGCIKNQINEKCKSYKIAQQDLRGRERCLLSSEKTDNRIDNSKRWRLLDSPDKLWAYFGLWLNYFFLDHIGNSQNNFEMK